VVSRSGVRIERVRLADLPELAKRMQLDPAFEETAPLSLLRAASLRHNPHAAPGDAVLAIAYAEGRCVGYHGLLPGYLSDAGRSSPVSWLITFYVSPPWRGQGIGAALVESVTALGVDLVTTGITAGAEKTYRACGFRDLGELTYWQLRMERFRGWVKPLAYAAVAGLLREAAQRWGLQPASEIPRTAPRLDPGEPGAPRFLRSAATVGWMIAHPWVVSAEAAGPDLGGYYFSRVREHFAYLPMRVGAAEGFLVSASRHRGRVHVKLLDLFFHHPADTASARNFTLAVGRRLCADRIDFPMDPFPRGCAGRFGRRMVKRRRRLYLYRPRSADSPLAAAAGRIALDYCDSDTAFT
jgi:GNAT superfamily N-acetyltransferase